MFGRQREKESVFEFKEKRKGLVDGVEVLVEVTQRYGTYFSEEEDEHQAFMLYLPKFKIVKKSE